MAAHLIERVVSASLIAEFLVALGIDYIMHTHRE